MINARQVVLIWQVAEIVQLEGGYHYRQAAVRGGRIFTDDSAAAVYRSLQLAIIDHQLLLSPTSHA
jgi:hypothetical protein